MTAVDRVLERLAQAHAADYVGPDWSINISELLRIIQFFNIGGYFHCPDVVPATEDGYCPGTPPM